MKTLFAFLLLGLMLLPCQAADDPRDITPQSSTSSATLNIVGPEDAIEVAQEVELRIEGLTLVDVETAQNAELFDLTAFPLKGVKVRARYDWLFRTLNLDFAAKYPGCYLLKIHIVRDGRLEIAAIVIQVADDEPDPPPPPPPPPPGPLAEMWVIVVEESSTRTPEQAWVLLDPTVRRWMTNNGHHLRIVDKDQKATDLQEWISRATAQRDNVLPYLFVVDDSGVVSFEGPLPIGPIQMLELVKKWGIEK